ncbi:Nucleolar 27S pre-rRNA processing Urb2/Npa2 [Venturia nashicola]|nr:Nucleolar 27S pre-rRNA processing Urb2/Npa2 [Venturia nashicola]
MAPMITSPSLPRLLSLDKNVKKWGQRLQQAADIAGIPLETNLDDSQIRKLACRSAAHGRAEWVLRWLLEKLKTVEGRQKSRKSPLTFVLLRRLLLFVPTSTCARFLNSSNIMDIIKNYLDETATRIGDGLDDASHQTIDSGSSVTLEDTQPSSPVSRKRKRTKSSDDDTKDKTSTTVAKDEENNLSSLGLFINEIIHLTSSSIENVDPVASQHLKGVLRTSTLESADILSAWLRCVLLLCQSRGIDVNSELDMNSIMRTHFSIVQIWQFRALEVDDDSGFSASTFSKACLVPVVALYAQIRPLDGNHFSLTEMKVSLEQLLARHFLIPGRASFSAMSTAKRTKTAGTQPLILDLLQPLRDMVVGLVNDDEHDSLRHLVSTLPSLLEQAIKLCPGNSTKQKLADASWIECFVRSLSHCAGEPIPYEESESGKPDFMVSPLPNMLKLVQENHINLSTIFLESLLQGYSGLSGVTDRTDLPVRWDLITVLLGLSGNVFLKEKPKNKDNPAESEYTNRIPPYVEALVGTVENTKWEFSLSSKPATRLSNSESPSRALQWSNSVDDAVTKILIPLMHAYISARNLNGFMDLWFRELRRHWGELGIRNERAMPWTSVHLRQEFQAALETSLTPARINERLIEYITPIKILLAEAARAPKNPNWADLQTIAPASVSLFMLDTVLHGIQDLKIFEGTSMVWRGLKGLSTDFAAVGLEKFACSYKVWSILTQIYTLSARIDGEQSIQEQLMSLSDSQILKGALAVIGEVRPHQVDGFQFEASREAYQFVVTVGSDLLRIPGLKERGDHYISTANNFLLHSVSRLKPAQIFQSAQEKEDLALSIRLKSSLAVLLSRPNSFSVFSSHERCGIFETIFYHTVTELSSDDSPTSFPVLLEALTSIIMEIGGDVKGRLLGLALNTTIGLQAHALTRKERESILDKISGPFEDKAEHDNLIADNPVIIEADLETDSIDHVLLEELSAMTRLMGQRNPTSELVSATHDATPERKELFKEKFTAQCTSEFDSVSLLEKLGTMFLLKSWVHVESQGENESQSLTSSPVSQFYKKTLNRDIGSIENAAASEVQQWAVFRALAEMPLASLEPIVYDLKKILRKMDDPDPELVKDVMESGVDPKETMDVLTKQLQSQVISPQDHNRLIEAFAVQVRALRPARRIELLQTLLGNDDQISEGGSLQLLEVLIKSLTPEDAPVFVEKGSLLIKLCHRVMSSRDIGHLGTSISCIKTVLRTKLWLVNQHGIDTLLGALATLASSRAGYLPKEHAPFIYLRLCQTATNIVLLHRKHLGGRMHLLVPLLQNLLTCLFKPHRHQGPRSVASLPSWLFNTPSPLDKTHSKAYTRLLSTLCSPTASSTSQHRKNAELTDTNKQAREYAGSYVPYVLMHYCSLQLGASVDSEVREGLKAGIWEMMGVVGIEGMRGMNVGMGRDERAIWEVVYHEWLRVGKGRSSRSSG